MQKLDSFLHQAAFKQRMGKLSLYVLANCGPALGRRKSDLRSYKKFKHIPDPFLHWLVNLPTRTKIHRMKLAYVIFLPNSPHELSMQMQIVKLNYDIWIPSSDAPVLKLHVNYLLDAY